MRPRPKSWGPKGLPPPLPFPGKTKPHTGGRYKAWVYEARKELREAATRLRVAAEEFRRMRREVESW